MKTTSKLTAFGLLAALAAASVTPVLADGRTQGDKNNMRNLTIAGAAVAAYGLLSGNNGATLLGAAGAALAGSQYEKDRHQQSQDSHGRYYYRDGRNGNNDRNQYDNRNQGDYGNQYGNGNDNQGQYGSGNRYDNRNWNDDQNWNDSRNRNNDRNQYDNRNQGDYGNQYGNGNDNQGQYGNVNTAWSQTRVRRSNSDRRNNSALSINSDRSRNSDWSQNRVRVNPSDNHR